MIYVVDDERAVSGATRDILVAEGHEVMVFDDAGSLLEQAETEEPEMIISDVMMPEMTGFELKDAYSSRYPHRRTPFVFLSSLSDTENMVRGLDLGADDYLTKPVNPELLKAKVRSILSRKKIYSVPFFCGDLSKLPFEKLLQFCELKGLTGEVEVSGGDTHIRIELRGGNLIIENLEDSVVEKLYDLSEGKFVISSYPVDFSEIEEASLRKEAKSAARMADKDKPMGMLSGVKANSKLFQLQTEFITFPENQIVTIVILDGKVLMKRKTAVPAGMNDRRAVEKMMAEQHAAVEGEVNDRVSDLIRKKATAAESPREKFSQLFEMGYDKYRDQNYEEALALWEEAYALNPSDKIVATNIRMLKKKLGID